MRRSILLVFVVGALLVAFVPQFVQGQARVLAPQAQYQYYNSAGSSLYTLLTPAIEKELEIVPEQKEKLIVIRDELSTRMRDTYKQFGDVDPAERWKMQQEAFKKLNEETEKKVQDVMLAHQLKRLQQIRLQMKLRTTGYGSASALSNNEVADALGLSQEQKEQLRQKEEEFRVEMQEKTRQFYEELQAEGREKLMGVLTESQRKKLADLTGEEFEWQTPYQSGVLGNAQKKKASKEEK